MRRVLCLLLAVCLLAAAGCGREESQADVPEAPPAETPEAVTPASPAQAAPEEPVFQFTRENFPVLDGSTSTVPLAEAAAAVLLGEEPETAAELIQFHKTTASYRRLLDGTAELLLAAEPAEAI